MNPIIIDTAIAIGLAGLGVVFGMDRTNNKLLDLIGPLLMLAGLIYSLYCGFYFIAGFIAFILVFKIVVR